MSAALLPEPTSGLHSPPHSFTVKLMKPLVFLLGPLFLITGCASPRMESLMPTPLVYSELGVGPMDGLQDKKLWKPMRVYYATTRKRVQDSRRIDYGNAEAQAMSLGMALINFGGPEVGWTELNDASRMVDRDGDWLMSVSGLIEAGGLDLSVSPPRPRDELAWLVADLNRALRESRRKEILLYVHGAKVDFYNACAFSAQLGHFLGRDGVSMAFSWPTRQRISAYAIGNDLARGRRSAKALSLLLEILGRFTEAERVHLVCWSAGGRVVTEAVQDLRKRYPDLDDATLRDTFRLGTVYYAASDVPRQDFLSALPILDVLAERVVVTASSQDSALQSAQLLMGGGPRIGQIGGQPLSESEQAVVESTRRLEVVDVSLGSPERGFDITGHRYWFNHPWASTELLLALRGLGPEARGLEPGHHRIQWRLPADYPERMRPEMLKTLSE